MAWIILILAGLGECFWAAMMKLSNGFTNIGYTIATIIGLIFSMAALIIATKSLPLSIAYPVWTGIGAVGTVIIGACFFKDQVSPITWFFVVLLIVCIIGIKVTGGE